MKSISFYGNSGAEYKFAETAASSNWVRTAGVAVFATRDAYGWRVIKITALTGRDHDVRPIWAFHEAQRFGADTVFVCDDTEAGSRNDIIRDMEAGLDPVVSSRDETVALAA